MTTLGIKRILFAAVGIVAGAASVLTVTGWLVNRQAVRAAIVDQIQAATGLGLVMVSEPRVSVFPTAAVRFYDVRLKDDNSADPAVSVDELTARLRLLPLLINRFEIADVTLVRPRFRFTRDASGDNNWGNIAQAVRSALKPRRDAPAVFSEIRIADGTLYLQDQMQELSETLTGIDGSLAWPSISRSFAATGQFRWHGDTVDASAALGDLAAALDGQKSSVKLRLTGKYLKFAFDGVAATRPALAVEGSVTTDTPSLRDALRWAGGDPPDSPGLKRFALRAQARIKGSATELLNVNLELDGNAAEGVLSYASGGRQTLQGTLAAETLDLTPYASAVRLLASHAREWNSAPLDLRWLNALDLDLRLSAARLVMGPTKAGRTALAANMRGGALTLSVGEVQTYGGTLKGSIELSRVDDGAILKSQLRFTDIDLGQAAQDVVGAGRMSGRGDVHIAADATGNSVLGLTRTLNGTASLKGRNGALQGFNIVQLLRRLERRPLSGAGDFRSGQTPFDVLLVDLALARGIATAQEVRMESPGLRLMLTGQSAVPEREFDLQGNASLIASSEAPQPFELPFVIQGPWDDPIVLPDPASLIRRSPASAPLLDSVRERRPNDAVRSAIERLGGISRPVESPPTEPEATAPAQPVQPPQEASPAVPAPENPAVSPALTPPEKQ